jgi:acetolactate synthase small subunit
MSTTDPRVFCFAVFAEPCPSALPRVLEVFAAQGLVPYSCHSQLTGPDQDQLAIEVQMQGLDGEAARQIARRLGAVVTVGEVLWSEKHRLVAA